MKDILHTEDGDIALVNGDILFGESTGQHQRDILLARKGDYALFPATGVGIADFANDETSDLLAEIRRQFAQDGMNVRQIILKNGNLTIDADY